jgi:serine protease AprX
MIAIALIPFCSGATELRTCLKKIQHTDSVCSVWVIFTDENSGVVRPLFPSRTLARRAKAGFQTSFATDFPVSPRNIREIQQSGGFLRNVFAWANAASFSIHASKLEELAKKKCVKELLPVRTFVARFPRGKIANLQKKTEVPDSGSYGSSWPQLRMVNVPAAHNYIINKLHTIPGKNIIIGLFDSGFRLNHHCFDHIKSNQSIIADSNFVDHNGEVADPDSIRQAFLSISESPPEEHGSQTLSLLAGYDPGKFLGVAWGARFILARTEWVGKIVNGKEIDIEVHGEEDNWVSALVWAESLGVDVVSSSIAYSTGFTDSSGKLQPQTDYTYNEFDGKTTIISKAAYEATRRGMLIVNSVGNEGSDRGSVNAPADVDDVVAVGGVSYDKSICDFSSRGPTSDGRIKPDVVTLASLPYLPLIYSSDSASYQFGGGGTSYSAPVIAGICALIRQTHPNDSAPEIRQRLYASCSFAPHQDSIDNAYGRGIPDAFVACYNDSLTPVSGVHFTIFPTTLDIVRKKQRLTLLFKAQADDPLHYSQRFIVTIRSISGRLVWSHAEYLVENQTVQLNWPETQKSYAPGMYYFIVNYAGKTHLKKFIILG